MSIMYGHYVKKTSKSHIVPGSKTKMSVGTIPTANMPELMPDFTDLFNLLM